MYRNCRDKTSLGVSTALAFALAAGCNHPPVTPHVLPVAAPTAPAAQPASSTSVSPAKDSAIPDLTKPFRASQEAGESWLAPLNFTRYLGRSAGGTWVAFAQKPLDDVKWQSTTNYRYGNTPVNMTVQQTLDAVRKAGTPIAWKNGQSGMVISYGPAAELDEIFMQPPTETVGFFARAESVPALLKAVGDIWRLQVDADPELIQKCASYSDARKKREDADKEDADSSLAAMYSGRYGVQSEQESKYSAAVEFKAVKRLDLDELMQELARSLGGAAHHEHGTHWRFTNLSDAKEIDAEIARLKAEIDQEAGSTAAAFTSFASRSGSENEQAAEAPATPIPDLSEESNRAFDALGRLGKSAVPALAGYLVPEKPSVAMASVRTLDAMATPEAKSALAAFARKLQTPPRKEAAAKAVLPQLQSDLIRRIGREPDAATVKLLGEIALSTEMPEATRTAARMALVGTGNLAPLVAASTAKEIPTGEVLEFELRDPPAGSGLQPMRQDQKRSAVVPLAIAKSASGEDWAVFVSGRLGNSNDLWLARGKGGKWSEFLLTGHVFTRSRQYGQEGTPKPGSCKLTVSGDKIVIGPPGVDHSAELQQIMKQMQDPKLAMEARTKLSTRYQEASQNVANVLEKPITLSLLNLRKDSDKDGLPDLVEIRLGLDPHTADTDGDGIPDGKDANPLAAPAKAPTDRSRILQSIFTALYGGDQAVDPIIVVLDRDEWQEFTGARARVLCITRDDYLQRAKNLGALRVLQFGGPKDADSTILKKDGPCLFNDAHTRAEVHFWQWRPGSGVSNVYSSYAMGAAPVTDYTAQFERKDAQSSDWKLVRFKPSHFETSDKAMAAVMSARMYGGDVDEP